MASKFGLGKGLDALLPPEDSPQPGPLFQQTADSPPTAGTGGEGGERYIPLDQLFANPAQPRKSFDEAALGELADSIREHGLIQPVIAEKTGDRSYTIVAGERRCRAARLAGLTEVPVLIREYSDEKRMEISLIENIQRADLNPVEEASAYRHLMEVTGLSQDEVAARVGKNRSTVTNALRLLRLPAPILGALESGAISPGHARALLSVRKAGDQGELYREILAEGCSVREAEKRAAALNGGQAGEEDSAAESPGPGVNGAGPETRAEGVLPAAPARDPHLAAMEQEFIEALGTKVAITGGPERGSIRIDYYSLDDLNRLYELLKK
ncbi:MAG: ParB/RepB/Spo0J family partition protein [Spirochaetaceae bacterium]|nr:ParB/RepB/Spo0J family partition protein [Spirochaetaceae bacterium]